MAIYSAPREEFMSSRDRTAHWVSNHAPIVTEDFYSPSVPPSELGSPLAAPSEISSHSIPPKMFLNYGDGRPDIPISHWHNGDEERDNRRAVDPNARLQQSQAHSRSRSISQGPLTAASAPENIIIGRHGSRQRREQRGYYPAPPRQPEEIRVLPSLSPVEAAGRREGLYAPRSKSLSRGARRDETHLPVPLQVPYNGQPMVQDPMHRSRSTPPVQVAFPQSRQPVPWHVNPDRLQKSAMRPHVYASANPPKHNGAVYSHPHSRGAPGVIYSHSAPLPSAHYAQNGVIPYPPPHALEAVDEERSRRSRSRSRSRRGRGRSTSDAGSHESDSTYFINPINNQKAHIIAPTKSISTATSTTKTPTSSPRTPSKKSFFSRIFDKLTNSNMESPKDSGKMALGGRRLQRRHSTGGSNRRPVPPTHEHR